MLQKDGAYALRKVIEASKACPIQGLYGLSTFHAKIWQMYDGANFEKPMETGWPVLNEFYKVVPGELTIVTGLLLCSGLLMLVAVIPQHLLAMAS